VGLLDDAIREHLELKRLHGADPTEIARQQHEALDPPGSEPAGGADAVPVADDPTIAEPPPPATEPAPAYDPAPVAAEPAAYESAPAYEPPPEPTAAPPAHVDAPELLDEPHHEAQPAAEEPPPGDAFDMQTAPPVDSAVVHQPTAEYAVEDLEALRDAPEPAHEHEPEPDRSDDIPSADEADADVADEDVLEETPEFLQETPEHDRLWFEQKPPRDFDF
jgi:hypothetical protein